MEINEKTLKAHQKHHGTGSLSDMILRARIANGWTEAEIAANSKGCDLYGEDDLEDEPAYQAYLDGRRHSARMARLGMLGREY